MVSREALFFVALDLREAAGNGPRGISRVFLLLFGCVPLLVVDQGKKKQ